jgi:hypothetical protein
LADEDGMPELAMIVTVERAFFHCGKCIMRSKLWNYEWHRAQAGASVLAPMPAS